MKVTHAEGEVSLLIGETTHTLSRVEAVVLARQLLNIPEPGGESAEERGYSFPTQAELEAIPFHGLCELYRALWILIDLSAARSSLRETYERFGSKENLKKFGQRGRCAELLSQDADRSFYELSRLAAQPFYRYYLRVPRDSLDLFSLQRLVESTLNRVPRP